MGGLSETDLRALGGLARRVTGFDGVAAFHGGVLGLVRDLVPCDVAAYNEVAPRSEDTYALTDPPEACTPAVVDAFGRCAWQNPLVREAQRSHGARRLSDYISQRELRGLELYRDVFRPLDVRHQLAATLPSDACVVGVTINRRSRDFAPRERDVLEAARPFLAAGYVTARERTRVRALLAAMGEPTGARVLLVGPGGALEPAHAAAESLLRGADTLERLRSWVRAQRRRSPRAPAALVVETDGEAYAARYVPGVDGAADVVVLRRAVSRPEPRALLALGLTARQAEVLFLAWEGHGNARIAERLGVSEHTVRHHLEQVYRRLGVSSRAAATRRAGETLSSRRW